MEESLEGGQGLPQAAVPLGMGMFYHIPKGTEEP